VHGRCDAANAPILEQAAILFSASFDNWREIGPPASVFGKSTLDTDVKAPGTLLSPNKKLLLFI
jgi:hypothetical protein